MGVPGADDIMLNYQSNSFHDALYLRSVLGLRPAPEFELGSGTGPRCRKWPHCYKHDKAQRLHQRTRWLRNHWRKSAHRRAARLSFGSGTRSRCCACSVRHGCPHSELAALPLATHVLHSAAANREIYLRRPDQGRRLSAEYRLVNKRNNERRSSSQMAYPLSPSSATPSHC